MKKIMLHIKEKYFEHAQKVADSEPYIYGPREYLSMLLGSAAFKDRDKHNNPHHEELRELKQSLNDKNVEIKLFKTRLRDAMHENGELQKELY